MMVTLTFKTDNAAFQDDNGPAEAARILRRVAEEIEKNGERGTWKLRDGNGNTVGSVSVRLPA